MLFYYFVLMFLLSSGFCQDCVMYNYSDDSDYKFSSNQCQETFEDNDLDMNNLGSHESKGVNQCSEMTCISSYSFTMHKGGILEVIVKNLSLSRTDALQIKVYEKETNGPNTIVGMETSNNNLESNTNTFRIEVDGSDSYTGYFTIVRRGTKMLYVFVDSFRYQSPTLIDEQFLCLIHDRRADSAEVIANSMEEIITEVVITTTEAANNTTETAITTSEQAATTTEAGTTISEAGTTISEAATTTTEADTITTEADIPATEADTTAETHTTTTDVTTTTIEATSVVTDFTTEPPITQGCVSYNFEENFEEFFGATGICSRLRTDLFQRRLYSQFGLNSPNEMSTVYITALSRMSCTASPPITMHANGVLQVHVFLRTMDFSDQISIIVYKMTQGVDQIVGSFVTNPRFHYGWNFFNITLRGDDIYEGYVAFMGQASQRSVVLIDSCSYIPPDADESSCAVYAPSPTSTFNPNENTSTTEPPESEAERNGCVVYKFGHDFNSLFTKNGCRHSSWLVRDYSVLKIDSPHENSETCIVPGGTASCTTSFEFPMSVFGVLEVKVYMEPMTLTDRVTITVHQVNGQGSTSLVGSGSVSRMYGWTTIRIVLSGNGDYNGQVTILGHTSIRTFAVVDSFRYVPPNLNERECVIYGDANN